MCVQAAFEGARIHSSTVPIDGRCFCCGGGRGEFPALAAGGGPADNGQGHFTLAEHQSKIDQNTLSSTLTASYALHETGQSA